MTKIISSFIELARIWILLMIILLVFGGAERYIYRTIFDTELYYWTMTLGNFIAFFVLYRNFLQFKGWYKSDKNKKLSRQLTFCLLMISIALVIVPALINTI